MARYTVVAPMGVTFQPPAVLSGLEADQLRRRVHALQRVGEGRFEVTQPVGFKHGETVGIEGAVNKALLQEIAEEGSPPAREARAEAKGRVSRGRKKAARSAASTDAGKAK